jgi:predicted helicase
MTKTIAFYNAQRLLLGAMSDRSAGWLERAIDRNPKKISWTANLITNLRKGIDADVKPSQVRLSTYRPFCKQWLYFDSQWNERQYQIPKLFPTSDHTNLVISANSADARRPFSALITDSLPDVHLHDSGQCFPLYQYRSGASDPTLFASVEGDTAFHRTYAINEATVDRYRNHYGADVNEVDIFYYVYGVLHSPEYRTRFASDLKKMIPRIPMATDFGAFSDAGRQLAGTHLGYESTEPWPLDGVPDDTASANDLRVTKMRFPRTGKIIDKSTIVFNSHVSLSGIPEEIFGYEVNGKSAIEWIMDRYEIKADRDSGIVNDPNLWSEDPRYVVNLVGRIVRVSLETVEIVKSLPPLGI